MAVNSYMSKKGGMKSARKSRAGASGAMGLRDDMGAGVLDGSMALGDVLGAPSMEEPDYLQSQEVATTAALTGLKDGLGIEDEMAMERRRKKRDIYGLELGSANV